LTAELPRAIVNADREIPSIRETHREESTMDDKQIVLDTMKKAGEPLNAGKIAELSGLERKAVDKAMAAMKKDGTIVSPVRCKWEPAEK
jgi:hypothetical protein